MVPAASTAVVRFGVFTFDRGERLLRCGTEEIALPPRVLGVLDLLLDRAGEVVPRQTLIDSVWKDAFVTDTSLAEAVSFLRQALGDDSQSPTYIQTVHRRGYRFVAPVVDAQPPASSAHGAEALSDVVKPSIAGTLVPWTIATVCALAAAAAIWQLTYHNARLPPVVRLAVDPPRGMSLDPRGPALAVSPDGAHVVMAACETSGCRLFIRAVDQLSAVPIAGTEDASAPFFSPDGLWIGFFGGGKLKKVALSGGAPVTLADAPQVFGATWLPDAAIGFADSRFGGLKRVSDSGGTPVPLTEPAAGELGHAWPAVLPDGRAIVFSVATSPLQGAPGPVAVVPYAPGGRSSAGPARVIVDAAELARPAGPDYLVYSRAGDLHALPFDRIRLAPAGAQQVALSGITPLQFAVSTSGALVYGVAPEEPPEVIHTVGSPAGQGLGDIADARAVSLSPDGRRATVVSDDGSTSDIWITDLSRGTTTRLTHGGINVMPVWNRDGSAVYYASRQHGRFEIWQRDSGATQAAVRRLRFEDGDAFPTSVADATLVFTVARRGAGIWSVPTDGGQPAPLVDTAFDETDGALSPDGKMLAYQSDESGRWEVYLLRLRDKRRAALSAGGGVAPFWARDGTTVFFQSGTSLMKSTISAAGDVLSATPVGSVGATARAIGLSPDGGVSLAEGGRPGTTQVVLTLEWLRELRRQLGPPGSVLPR